MIINCIIVEDEPSSQKILKKYISECIELNLVATCNNAIEAMDMLNNNHIDLIFLDINMPKLSGLGLLKSLTNPPNVIFTTAYPEYAVDGFEVNAIDFLLKPFSLERFLKAINKYKQVNTKAEVKESQQVILLNANKKLHRINISDIFIVEAQGDYVKVYLKDKHLMVHKTMTQMEKELPNDEFTRVHKSYIVAYKKLDYVEGNMLKINNMQIPIGKTNKAAFLELLKNI